MKKLILLVGLMLFAAVQLNSGTTSQIWVLPTSKVTEAKFNRHIFDKELMLPPKILLDPKQKHCLALNIYFEAAIESTAGKLAVAQVTLNRVKSEQYPETICKVVYEGSHFASGHPKRDMCQFSWYCDGKGDIPGPGPLWEESQRVAREMVRRHITAQLLDITDGATHYHASWMERYPRWSNERKKMTHIDQHIFYR